MRREDAIDLAEGLDGDEHVWVDCKEDYYIKGTEYLEAEFVKDVQSLANALCDRDKRYLLIGVDDGGDIVGVDSEADDDSVDQRHILSFEADDLQDIVDARLSRAPQLSLSTFEKDGNRFAVLGVEGVEKPPIVTTSTLIDDSGNTHLTENEIWVRKSSGKKEADKDELETLIEHRVDQVRDSLMSGIRRVVELDPDTIAAVGDLEPREGVEADITFEVDEEGDYTVNSRLTGRTFNSLQTEVDSDLAKRERNPNHFIDKADLMRYYANSDEVPEDVEAISLYAESALNEWLPGTFWLSKLDVSEHRDFLKSVPDENPVRNTVCKSLLIADMEEAFEEYVSSSSSMRSPRFDQRAYRRLFDSPLEERFNKVCGQHSKIEYAGLSIELEYDTIDRDSITENIGKIARKWLECDSDNQRSKLKYAIKDLELMLAVETLGES